MKKRVGFDLDGIIIDKPPLIPKKLIEWFFRGSQENLNYRFPKTKIEQLIRKFSHFYLFRPPIKKNIALIKKIHQQKKHDLYLVSSRYSFLQKETQFWLKKRKIDGLFEKIYLNTEDSQPHLFKEKKLKRLELDFYFEDDELIVDYLDRKLKNIQIFLVDDRGKHGLLKKFFSKYLK